MRETGSQTCLAEFIREVSEGEQQVEMCRELLVQRPDFEPLSCFQLLDQRAQGYLTSLDLSRFLETHKLFLSAEESHLLAKSMSADSSGQVSYPGFLAFVLPDSRWERERAVNREPVDRPSFQVEYALVRLMEREVQVMRQLTPVKQRILSTSSLLESFRTLDTAFSSSWTPDDLLRFSLRYSIRMDEKLLKGVFRRLDRNRDGRIDYSDFVDSMVLLRDSVRNEVPEPRGRLEDPTISHLRRSSKDRARQDSIDRLRPARESELHRQSMDRLRESSPERPYVPLSQSTRSAAQPLRQNRSQEKPYLSPSRTIPAVTRPVELVERERDLRARSGEYVQKPQEYVPRLPVRSLNRGYETDRGIAPDLSDHFSLSKPLKMHPETDRAPVSLIEDDLNDRVPLESIKANRSSSAKRVSGEEPAETFGRVLREQLGVLFEVERSKQELALCGDFSVETGFQEMAKGGRRVGMKAFEDGLRNLGVSGTSSDIHSLFKRYDRNMDLSLDLAEFSDLVKPECYEHSNLMNRRPVVRLNSATVESLRRVFSKLVEYEEFVSKTASRLSHDIYFSLRSVYETLDISGLGYFTRKGLADFLVRYGVEASEAEISMLFRRYDLNGNNRVPYSEFQRALRLI